MSIPFPVKGISCDPVPYVKAAEIIISAL